jgi:RNA polymerase sigma-B factor
MPTTTDIRRPDAHAALPVSPAGRPDRRVGEYRHLEPLFAELAALAADDPRRKRLRDDLVAQCMPLAQHVAQRFRGRGEPFDDLLQVARLGLLHAVDRFDASRGSPFIAFAVPTVMGEVRRYFRDNTWTMRIPRRVQEIHLRIGPAVERLTHSLRRAPTAGELAVELDVHPDDVAQALIAGNAYQPASLDAPTTGDGDDTVADMLGRPEPRYELVDEYLSIEPMIAQLPERERRVLELRFFGSQTQSAIAAQLGVSQMQISRILSATLDDLRRKARQQ